MADHTLVWSGADRASFPVVAHATFLVWTHASPLVLSCHTRAVLLCFRCQGLREWRSLVLSDINRHDPPPLTPTETSGGSPRVGLLLSPTRLLLCLVLLLLLIALFGLVSLTVRELSIVPFGLAIVRSLVGWSSLYLSPMMRRGILRLVLVRLSVTGCVVGGVSLLFVGASPIQSRGHARCLALLLVLSCPSVQLLAAVGRSSARELGASPPFLSWELRIKN